MIEYKKDVLDTGCIIRWCLKHYGDRVAIEDGDQKISYQALDHQLDQITRQIPDNQLSLTSRVKGSLSDIYELLAALRAHRCLLPVNPKLPDSFLNQILNGIQVSQFQPTLQSPISNIPGGDFPAHWILTSGSTGLPKIAQISFGAHLSNALGALTEQKVQPAGRFLQSLPLFHIAGIAQIFRCFLSGSTLVIDHSEGQTDWIMNQRISHISLVTTQLRRLLRQSKTTSHCFRQILLGGGPIPEALSQTEWPIFRSYGLTEMASQVVTADATGLSCLLPERDLKISESGEVLVRGPCLFDGYVSSHGVKLPVDKQGWFATGDLGFWNGSKFVITGRKDLQFISGGENIQPEAIESKLLMHPDITQAAVMPLKDSEFEYRPIAFLRLAGVELPAGLNDWLKNHIPGYMIPVAYYKLPDFPGFKINRSQLSLIIEQESYEPLEERS